MSLNGTVCPEYLDASAIKILADKAGFYPKYTHDRFVALLQLKAADADFSSTLDDALNSPGSPFKDYLNLAADCILPAHFKSDLISADATDESGPFFMSGQLRQSKEAMVRLQMYMRACHDGRGHKLQALGLLLVVSVLLTINFVVIKRFVKPSPEYGFNSLLSQVLSAGVGLLGGRSAAQLLNIRMAYARIGNPDKKRSCLSVLYMPAWIVLSVLSALINVTRNITVIAEKMDAPFKTLQDYIGVTFDLPLILMTLFCFMATLSWGLKKQDKAAAVTEFELGAVGEWRHGGAFSDQESPSHQNGTSSSPDGSLFGRRQSGDDLNKTLGP